MIIFGINPILESLQSDRKPETLYIQSGKRSKRLDHVVNMAEKLAIPVEIVDNLEPLCGRNVVHQRVAGRYADTFTQQLKKLPQDVDRIVLFDGLEDPHNFGAGLRVCEVFGFPHIIFHKGNSSGLTSVAAKSSAGAVFHVNLYVSNLNQAVKLLKEWGYTIICLEAEGAESIFDVELPERFCLVIGSEGKGVRHMIREQADKVVKIPMHGRVNSLNVSCALSATLCEFSRRLN
jgi:23S rRNA (guanosine2251-2'-O)-methyltransferase